MKYSKKQTYHITSKIYKFLKENPDNITISKFKARNLEGLYDPDTCLITLDPRKELLPTLIHELIHHWHDDWDEKRVVKEEHKVVRSLSLSQMKHIIKFLAVTL